MWLHLCSTSDIDSTSSHGFSVTGESWYVRRHCLVTHDRPNPGEKIGGSLLGTILPLDHSIVFLFQGDFSAAVRCPVSVRATSPSACNPCPFPAVLPAFLIVNQLVPCRSDVCQDWQAPGSRALTPVSSPPPPLQNKGSLLSSLEPPVTFHSQDTEMNQAVCFLENMFLRNPCCIITGRCEVRRFFMLA